MGWTKTCNVCDRCSEEVHIKEIVWNARGGYSKTANKQPSH